MPIDQKYRIKVMEEDMAKCATAEIPGTYNQVTSMGREIEYLKVEIQRLNTELLDVYRRLHGNH